MLYNIEKVTPNYIPIKQLSFIHRNMKASTCMHLTILTLNLYCQAQASQAPAQYKFDRMKWGEWNQLNQQIQT